jgi:hypothetical protein
VPSNAKLSVEHVVQASPSSAASTFSFARDATIRRVVVVVVVFRRAVTAREDTATVAAARVVVDPRIPLTLVSFALFVLFALSVPVAPFLDDARERHHAISRVVNDDDDDDETRDIATASRSRDPSWPRSSDVHEDAGAESSE